METSNTTKVSKTLSIPVVDLNNYNKHRTLFKKGTLEVSIYKSKKNNNNLSTSNLPKPPSKLAIKSVRNCKIAAKSVRRQQRFMAMFNHENIIKVYPCIGINPISPLEDEDNNSNNNHNNSISAIPRPTTSSISSLSLSKSSSNATIAMEYCDCDGVRYFNYLYEREKLSIELIKKYCIDCLNGLKIIHEKQFVHSDFKLENVFIKILENKDISDESNICFKIGDFGGMMKIGDNSGNISCKNMLEWTGCKCAPEIATHTLNSLLSPRLTRLTRSTREINKNSNKKNNNNNNNNNNNSNSNSDTEGRENEVTNENNESSCTFDTSCDIWAFGVSLYEAVMGEEPFTVYDKITDRKKRLSTLVNIKTRKFANKNWEEDIINRFNSTVNKTDIDGLINLINLCLERDPLQRPSAKELLKHSLLAKKQLPAWVINFFGMDNVGQF